MSFFDGYLRIAPNSPAVVNLFRRQLRRTHCTTSVSVLVLYVGSLLIQIWRLGTGKVFVRSPTKTYLRVYQTPNHFDGQEFWAQTFDFCAPYSEVTIGTSYDTDMNMLELLRGRSFWQVCETVNLLPLTYIQDLVTWREYFEQFVVP